jgi:hypothetical protein
LVNTEVVVAATRTNRVTMKFSHSMVCSSRDAEMGFGLRWKKIFCATSKGRPAKNLCSKLERLTVRCRVTWARSERVNL